MFSEKRQQDEVLDGNGKVRTDGTDPGTSIGVESDVREETKETARCFFTDLWRLNGDKGEGITFQGILGEGTSTPSTGRFVCDMGTGGDGKAQADEDEHRRYDYKDPSIQLLHRSYMHIWGTKGEHIDATWRSWEVSSNDTSVSGGPC